MFYKFRHPVLSSKFGPPLILLNLLDMVVDANGKNWTGIQKMWEMQHFADRKFPLSRLNCRNLPNLLDRTGWRFCALTRLKRAKIE